MKLFLLIYLAVFDSGLLLSYPEMTRLGYSSCSTCHVSPSGGGALKAYGRAIAGGELSTFGTPEQASYWLAWPRWIAVGGDTRYTNVTYEAYNYKGHKHFLMQTDIEIAVSPVPGLTVAGTVGMYNVEYPQKRKAELEQRRNYVLIDLSKNFSVRAGRYHATHGLHFADHTLASRRFLGYGEGQETYNVEGSAKNSLGEVFFTGVNGQTGKLEANGAQGYKWISPGPESGFVGRAAYYLGQASQLGISGQRLVNRQAKTIRTTYGAFGILSFTPKLYTMFEVNRLLATNEKPQIAWVARQGLELYKGVHLNATYEGVSSQFSAWRWGLQLFPVPHWDVFAEYQRQVSEKGLKTEAWVFVLHSYL